MLNASPSAAIVGAVELFLGNRAGLKRFDFSVEGFWHSFGAAFYGAPLYALIVAGDWTLLSAAPDTPALSTLIIARIADFALDFVAMPVLLALLAQRLRITRAFGGYVVVRNWSTLVMLAPQALIALAMRLGGLSDDSAALLSLAIVVVMLFYQYRIVRWTLGWTAGPAAAFVAVDTLLSLILVSLVNALFGL